MSASPDTFGSAFSPIALHFFPEGCSLETLIRATNDDDLLQSVKNIWPYPTSRTVISAEHASKAIDSQLLSYARTSGLDAAEIECVCIVALCSLPLTTSSRVGSVGSGSVLVDGSSSCFLRLLRCMIPKSHNSIRESVVLKLFSAANVDHQGRVAIYQWLLLAWQSNCMSARARHYMNNSMYNVTFYQTLYPSALVPNSKTSMNDDEQLRIRYAVSENAVRLLIEVTNSTHVTSSRLRRLKQCIDDSETTLVPWIKLWLLYNDIKICVTDVQLDRTFSTKAYLSATKEWKESIISQGWIDDFNRNSYNATDSRQVKIQRFAASVNSSVTFQTLRLQLDRPIFTQINHNNLLSYRNLQLYWTDKKFASYWEHKFTSWWRERWYGVIKQVQSTEYRRETPVIDVENESTNARLAAPIDFVHSQRIQTVHDLAQSLVLFVDTLPACVEDAITDDILPWWNGEPSIMYEIHALLLPRLNLKRPFVIWQRQVFYWLEPWLWLCKDDALLKHLHCTTNSFLIPLLFRYDKRIRMLRMNEDTIAEREELEESAVGILHYTQRLLHKVIVGCNKDNSEAVTSMVVQTYVSISRLENIYKIHSLPSKIMLHRTILTGSMIDIDKLSRLLLDFHRQQKISNSNSKDIIGCRRLCEDYISELQRLLLYCMSDEGSNEYATSVDHPLSLLGSKSAGNLTPYVVDATTLHYVNQSFSFFDESAFFSALVGFLEANKLTIGILLQHKNKLTEDYLLYLQKRNYNGIFGLLQPCLIALEKDTSTS